MTKIILYITFLLLLVPVQTNNTTDKEQEYVYICTGNYSECYHKTKECEGLKYCSKEIKKITIEEAKNKYNRRACNYCCSK